MADLTVQILFSGLIAFAPNSAMLATKATMLVLNDVSSTHMPHQAFLSVPAGSVDEEKSDLQFDPDPADPRKLIRAFIGSGYVLTIDNPPVGNPPALDYKDCRSIPPRDGQTPQNVCLLKANQLRASDHTVDPDILNSAELWVAKHVALRFVVEAGTLKPHQPTGTGFLAAREVKWDFPVGTTRQQYVPELMEWMSPKLQGTELTLVLTPLGGECPRKVKFKSVTTADPIKILISNEPNVRDYCASKAGRFTVSHLGRLARFSNKSWVSSKEPALTDYAEMVTIYNFCENLGTAAGRQPIICYGNEMGP